MSKPNLAEARQPATRHSPQWDPACHQGVHHLFERQVELTPDAVAIVCESDSLTYSQLNRRANALAARLHSAGVRRGSVVAIFAGRPQYAVIAMLAALKSGASYVPIDIHTPQKRARYCLSNSGAECVLSDDSSMELASRLMPGEMRAVDVQDPSLHAMEFENPSPPFDPSDDAYCMYTSGSTGSPKGVVMHHKGLANYVCWASRQYLADDIRNFALFTSLAFDLTITSVFVPLISGRCVHIYPESHSNPSPLERLVLDNRADILKLTPSHLAILRELDLRDSSLKVLILGGEDLRVDAAAAISKRLPRLRALYNEYGPTEAAVGCMIHKFDPHSDLSGSVPIGQPIDGMRIHLLDDRLESVEPGAIGQIHIEGIGVATGYKSDADATAIAFLEDPFMTGQRVYASGDLAMVGHDGQLRFMGRKDSQVKVRGHRVEPAEVERAMCGHPDVIECVVVSSDSGATGAAPNDIRHCSKCGIPSNVPNTVLGEGGVCNHCLAVEERRQVIDAYFQTMEDLASLCDGIKAEAQPRYDCIVALSGGKDSTYMLCRLLELGLRVFAFTLDNGYISEEAKANIARTVSTLRVTHRYVSTPHMREIFADSLRRHSNVCNGCFKTIYTIAIELSQELQVRYVFIGLSKGQLFETRASELLRLPSFDKDSFERNLVAARKVYHRIDDAVSRLLDTGHAKNETVLESIRFVDFYRYCHSTRDDIYRYIEDHVGWVRPSDTGRSTNCKMNEVGIYVHTRQRRFHNYALPYSWEVRFGHLTRDAAMRELDDLREVNLERVTAILRDIGFDADGSGTAGADTHLIAYYVAPAEIPDSELRSVLLASLPEYMVPARFVHLDRIPLTPNGKVNRAALPNPVTIGGQHEDERTMTPFEGELVSLWREVLKRERIGLEDDFFMTGGASLTAVILLHKIRARYGKQVSIHEFSQSPTIRGLARRILEQKNSYS